MGARKLKGGNMANIAKLIKKAAPAIKGGYAAAKSAVGKITKKTDLDKLAEQIRRQSKAAQQPGKRLSQKGMKKEGNVSRFVERRKQLKGRKPKGNTAGTLGTYGVGVAAGSGATALGMKHRQKKKGKK